MKMTLIAILFSLLSLNAVANTKQCQPSADSCEMYLCVEENMNCGYKGYPLRIGYRFCEIFKKFKPTSLATITWVDKVRYCIQDKQKESHKYQCNQLAANSVKEHLDCYVDNGYCELNQKDRTVVRKYLIKNFLKAPKFFYMNMKNMLRNGCI
jgi:hypothetical protein